VALQTPPAPDRDRSSRARRSDRSLSLLAGTLLAALTLALAACGGGSIGGSTPRATTAAATSAAASGDAATAAGGAASATTTSPVRPPRSSAAPPATTAAPGSGASRSGAAPATDSAAPPPATTPSASAGGGAAQAQSRADAGAPQAAAAPQAAPDPPPAGTPIDELAVLRLVRRASAVHYFQQGTVTGTYDGTMAADETITARGVVVRFTATVAGGTISGRALATPVIDGSPWSELRGSAVILRGTGRFAGVHGRRLRVGGRGKLDGSRAHVRLTGTVSYE